MLRKVARSRTALDLTKRKKTWLYSSSIREMWNYACDAYCQGVQKQVHLATNTKLEHHFHHHPSHQTSPLTLFKPPPSFIHWQRLSEDRNYPHDNACSHPSILTVRNTRSVKRNRRRLQPPTISSKNTFAVAEQYSRDRSPKHHNDRTTDSSTG